MRQRRAEARLLDTEGKPGQNRTCKFPCMWLVRDNFFRCSGPITKLDAPSSMIEPLRNWLGMGATIPARIQPGSIDHVPFPTVVPCLGASSGKRKFSSREAEVRPPIAIERRGNRNASCSAGVAWSGSVAGVRSGKWPQRGSKTNRGLFRAAKLICAGES